MEIGRINLQATSNKKVGNSNIEAVDKFCYLGSTITNGNMYNTEITRRIKMAKYPIKFKLLDIY